MTQLGPIATRALRTPIEGTKRRKVYVAIAAYIDIGQNPSISELADRTGLHRLAVLVAVDKLEEAGYLEIQRERGKVNRYELCERSDGHFYWGHDYYYPGPSAVEWLEATYGTKGAGNAIHANLTKWRRERPVKRKTLEATAEKLKGEPLEPGELPDELPPAVGEERP